MPLILGIAGMAKNTGKTTTTGVILAQAEVNNIPTAITSIGLDGEEADQVTGLPKPRICVHAGVLVITAEACLKYSTATLDFTEPLGITTPIGPLIIGRVKKPGTVLLAGPNKRSSLQAVAKMATEKGAKLLVADGALNRMAPLAGSDIFVLTTGAARTPHIPTLSAETRAVINVLRTRKVNRHTLGANILKYIDGPNRDLAFIGNNEDLLPLPFGSLLSSAMVDEMTDWGNCLFDYLYVPGVLSVAAWRRLLAKTEEGRAGNIIMANPVNLLLGGDIFLLNSCIEEWHGKGGIVSVVLPLPLCAVTFNPFYPLWEKRGSVYQPAFVDERDIKEALADLPVPVFNVLKDDAGALWDSLFGSKRVC